MLDMGLGGRWWLCQALAPHMGSVRMRSGLVVTGRCRADKRDFYIGTMLANGSGNVRRDTAGQGARCRGIGATMTHRHDDLAGCVSVTRTKYTKLIQF